MARGRELDFDVVFVAAVDPPVFRTPAPATNGKARMFVRDREFVVVEVLCESAMSGLVNGEDNAALPMMMEESLADGELEGEL